MILTNTSFESIYQEEQDAKVKERMLLLVLNVVYYHMVAAHVVKDLLHRHQSWASIWLKRYDKEGIEGLKDRTKDGRSPKLSKKITCRKR